MRLITFKMPNGLIGAVFTNAAEPTPTLHNTFPWIKGCKIQLDLQVDIQQDQIKEDAIYLPLDEQFTELNPFTEPILSNLEAIGDVIEEQLANERTLNSLMQEKINTFEVEPLE